MSIQKHTTEPLRPDERDITKIPFCHVCEQLKAPSKGPALLLDVQTSATNGCPTCSIVSAIYGPLIQTPRVTQYAWIWYEPESRVHKFTGLISLGFRRTFEEELTVFTTDDSTMEFMTVPLPQGSIVTASTSAPEVWPIVLRWLKQCEEKHRAVDCVSASCDSILPSRVLDLGNARTEIRVLETGGALSERYITLSHCWGPEGCSLKTTTQNLSEMKSGISMDRFPRTFRDAIIFSRWLGIRYLWIDALCILQDSVDDWEREAGAMADVYANSYLTLAATGAICDEQGLFNTVARDHCQAKIQGVEKFGIYVREPDFHADLNIHDMLEHWQMSEGRREKFPLLSRAWAFQEQVLSPRVLHFTKTEMYWVCAEDESCECGMAQSRVPPDPTIEKHGPVPPKLPLSLSPSSQENYSGADSDRFGPWKRFVEYYMQKKLTYPTDRLPAISGLVKRLQSTLPGTKYCAGIWQNENNPLGWHQWEPVETEIQDYIAPSWSWASAQSSVSYETINKDQISYRILSMECVPLGSDITGRVVSGTITVEGRIEYIEKIPPSGNPARRGAYHLSSGANEAAASLRQSFDAMTKYWDGSRPVDRNRDFSLLLLGLCLGYCDPADAYIFLIIRATPGKPSTYTRVGMAIDCHSRMDSRDGGLTSVFTPRSHFITTSIIKIE